MCCARCASHCIIDSKSGLVISNTASVQVAYLASTLFLDYKDDTIILVVNTLSTDLRSDNYLVGMLTKTSFELL